MCYWVFNMLLYLVCTNWLIKFEFEFYCYLILFVTSVLSGATARIWYLNSLATIGPVPYFL